MTEIRFKDWTCRVEQERYANGRTAIQLVDAEDDEPVATATVNLPDEPCGPDEVFIKNYAENRGILKALVDSDVVSEPTSWVRSGFVEIPKCRLTGRGL